MQDGIAQFSSNVSRIADLHSRTLNSADDNASRQSAALLDDLVGQTRELSNSLKEKIQSLSSFPVTRPQDQQIRKNQVRCPVFGNILPGHVANFRYSFPRLLSCAKSS